MEVRNRFKGLDLIDRVPEELWLEVHNIVQEAVIKPFPRKRNAKRQSGCLMRLKIAQEKKRSERQRRKGKIYSTGCRVLEKSKEK